MVCQHNTNWSSNTLVPEVLEPNSDDVQNRQWVDRLDAQWLEGIWRIKGKEPIESTSGVSTKDPSNLKLVIEWFLITLKVWELGNSTYLGEEGAWCLYTDIELKILWNISYFLMRRVWN